MYPLVFQTDFGLVDGAVSAMYGVAYCVSPELKVHDLTHDITPYNVWEASYRLIQTVDYWPENTVFVSVVDPGVGSARKSIVARTKTGKYIVTPDNGTLTHILRRDGISAVREIDERTNRLPNSGDSYTFYGRDVYAYTGAIDFDGVGPELDVDSLVKRLKAASAILIPLVLSSLERIEMISNAMELRGFGKEKQRTWYVGRDFRAADYISMALCAVLLAVSIGLTMLNGSRFFNPFVG